MTTASVLESRSRSLFVPRWLNTQSILHSTLLLLNDNNSFLFRLPFRKLVKLYGVDLAYTPMIYAENFVSSAACRANEFTTDDTDNPIVQFAAKTPVDFANAAELVYG